MKLKKLFKNIPVEAIKGSKEIEITGICSNSKLVAPGNLFIDKSSGKGVSGSRIAEAISAGAVAILTDIYDPFLGGVVQILHKDVAAMEPLVCHYYYNQAYQQLFRVAYTGTNGKTTGTYLIKHLFDQLNLLCGVIGTIECVIGNYAFASTLTTPDIATTHKLFFEMVQNGCKAVAMEVSSHALAQERVRGLTFDIAVFTNLTPEHLDYHENMLDYAQSKAKLFSHHAKRAVINLDSPWASTMVADSRADLFTYAIDAPADLRAENIELSSKGIAFDVCYQGQRLPCKSTLIGRFNVYNCLAAMGVALLSNASLDRVVTLLESFKNVSGRLERVKNKAGIDIFVDYAHTEDALHNVLTTLIEIKKGRLITVFGCGGDRDRSKRAKMAAVVERFSDLLVITSDNPRSEKPEAIAEEMLTGIQQPEKVDVELDRERAIQKAIRMAEKGDIVLIAGKGHETQQIFAHQVIEFDDRKVAHAATLTLNV